MIKKLIARVQKLNPTLKENENNFSFCIDIEPENKKQSINKGSIYAIFDISSNTKFDINILKKVIKDVLSDTYYNNDSISPNQSIEKALVKVKDTIYSLQKKYSTKDEPLNFSSIIAVLWGDVFYIVKYNESLAYIMKETTLEPIETVGEGNLNFASIRVKPDQVAVLCTKDFGIKYPPNILLTKALSNNELKLNDSCLLLKFIEDTSITVEELKNLNALASPNKVGVENIIDTISKKFQTFNTNTFIKEKKLFNAKPKINKKSTLDILKSLKSFNSIKFNTKSITNFNFKNKLVFIFIFISILTISFLFFINLDLFNNKNDDNIINPSVPSNEDSLEVVIEEPILFDTSNDNTLSIERVDISNTLYDMSLINSDIDSKFIGLFNDNILVVDSKNNLYISSLNSIKFNKLPTEIDKINYFNIIDNVLYYSNDETLNEYNLLTNSIENTYEIKVNNALDNFNDFVYTIEDDKLLRYSLLEQDVSSTIWAQSNTFNDVQKIQIAYSIYLLNSNNTIDKYTTGRKDEFVLDNLELPLANVSDFIIKNDFNNLYVSDSENSRVVVFSDTGDYLKQYRYIDNSGFNDIKSIEVSEDEKTLYVLNGNKIYEIELQ